MHNDSNNRRDGVVIGTVVDLEDPDGEAKVRVEFPWLDETRSAWAPIAAPMAGGSRGVFFMPEEGDEVLVAFEHGQFDHPYIVGFLWNGADAPPSGDPRERMIMSRNGHSVRFLDSTPNNGNTGGVIVQDAMGNKVILTAGKVSVTSPVMVELAAPMITMKMGGVTRTVLPVPRPI